MRTFYLLNLAFALIALNSSLVASFVHKRSRDLSGGVGCLVISILVHFSLISVILWTAADTFFLFVNVAYVREGGGSGRELLGSKQFAQKN